MKLSTRTLKAAQKAAEEQGMTVDEWADKVLSRAASAEQAPKIEDMLREISRKVDQIVEDRHVGDKVSDQVGSAIEEIGASFQRIRKTTGRVFEKVRTQASTAVGEVAGKATEAFGHAGQSASGLVTPVAASSGERNSTKASRPKKNAVPMQTPKVENPKSRPKRAPATKGNRDK